jgi:hypothetical protein
MRDFLVAVFAFVMIFATIIGIWLIYLPGHRRTAQEMVGLDQYTRADMCLRLRDVTLKMWDEDVRENCRIALADYMRDRRVVWDRDWREATP